MPTLPLLARLPLWITVLLLVAVPAWSQDDGEGFYRVSGTEILGPDGEPVILKGLGLGGWLVPEGYMIQSFSEVNSPTRIREAIVDLVGEANAEEFYRRYEANYVAEADIALIADWGFDHIRLPFHWNKLFDAETETLVQGGFEQIDTFVEWCRTYGLGVILDMHAAPGAQSADNISDSDGVARLWTEPDPYWDWTVAIWTELARRYADDPIIIGYDLINEPVLPDGIPASDLRELYVLITDAIRAVDTNHILFIEGNFYARDFGALEEPWDAQMVYAFHYYWGGPNLDAINYLLALRENSQRPLWLGETGENSNSWYYTMSRLAEEQGIGWNWWTHKKLDTVTSPLSAPFPNGYQAVLDYWNGNGPEPTPLAARAALFELADNLALDRSVLRPGVLASLLDPDYATLRLPFKEHTIPGTIDFVDYDLGNEGTTYRDSESLNTSGMPRNANNGGAYRNDGVDMERSTDPLGGPYNIGWTETLEMTSYTVTVEQSGRYTVEFRVASNVGGGQFSLFLDGQQRTPLIDVGNTGGWQSWQTVTVEDVILPAGEHILEVVSRRPGHNLNRMTFTFVEPVATEDDAQPAEAALLGVYPNPTVGEATLAFRTPTDAEARTEVFDLIGRLVWTSETSRVASGTHRITVPDTLTAGVYVVRLSLDDGRAVQTFERRVSVLR
ncbi:MAG: cellulase family glycosylhydrolase [Bacteroidota bacterium]